MSESVTRTTRDLIRFLLKDSELLRSPVIVFVVIASGSRTGLIFLINETAERGGPTVWLFSALMGVAGVMLLSTHLATMANIRIVQNLASKMRRNITGKLLRADVGYFQANDPGTLFHNATNQVDVVANSTSRVADAIQAVLLLIFVLVYMLVQMPASVLATVIALMLGVTAFFLNERPATRAVQENHVAFVSYNNSLHDLLRGYKELRLRRARRRDLTERVGGQIKDLKRHAERAERHYSFGNVSASGALAALLVSVVVVLPALAGADAVTMLQILTLVLFSFSPIEAMIAGLPQLARAGVAYRNYRNLDVGLSQNAEVVDPVDVDARTTFQTIELRDVKVELTREVGDDSGAVDRFTLGPINMTIKPGQSVFVTGGNGMGKSTLLSLMTGLRHPDAGQILIDGIPVTRENVSDYRSVFSAVFSEFYLFRQLYGLSEDERARLLTYIDEMGLTEGVSIEVDRFTNLSLSTGQMRRLALSIALAEKRPIIVLDEFAADQDPTRRRFFYDELVPRLAAEGHCVLAVTHDEHCFEKADRLIRMEDGKIVSDELTRKKTLA